MTCDEDNSSSDVACAEWDPGESQAEISSGVSEPVVFC